MCERALDALATECKARSKNHGKSKIPCAKGPSVFQPHNARSAAKNMEKRRAHLSQCEEIIATQVSNFAVLYKTRQVEIAMRKVPEQVKEIRRKALEEIFAKDIEALDSDSKEVLDSFSKDVKRIVK